VAEAATAFAPGRVNLIGDHTDYNRGLALPFAIGQGVTVSARRAPGRSIEASALDLDAHDRFALPAPPRAGGWRAYVRGAAAELERAGVALPGARLEFSGTVPRGAGLSSSAALEVALCLALLELSDAPRPDRIELAALCSRIENEWVGAQTGLLDQIASLCGEPERALEVDFRSLRIRTVKLELDGYSLVTLDSGERRALARSGYNQRRAECVRACEALGVESLRDVTPEMTERLAEPLRSRARHVVSENERVVRAASALERGELPELGRLLDESHASLRDCYAVSTPAVEDTVRRLHAAGAVGARIVGGGFGGQVLGLLAPGAVAPEGAVEVRPCAGARLVP
jgi:galactokinase